MNLASNLLNKTNCNKKEIYSKNGKICTVQYFDNYFVFYSAHLNKATRYDYKHLESLKKHIESDKKIVLIETYKYK